MKTYYFYLLYYYHYYNYYYKLKDYNNYNAVGPVSQALAHVINLWDVKEPTHFS